MEQPEMTYRNLKWPTMNKKWPETTYNEQETTWSNPQQVRHNLQQSELINNEQKNMQNHHQQADFEIILQYEAINSLL